MKEKHFTFAINLKERPDRLAHINKEFEGRSEFNFKALSYDKKTPSTQGLWENVLEIINIAKSNDFRYVIICQDDHVFTEYYNSTVLNEVIREGKSHNADILIGGVSYFNSALQISEKLFWVERFSGLQFMVVFENFFDVILKAESESIGPVDHKISNLTNKKFIVYPFISVQEDFGYSDVTSKNNSLGSVRNLFTKSAQIMGQLRTVKDFYGNINHTSFNLTIDQFDNIYIPLYAVINPQKIEEQNDFAIALQHRTEFKTSFIGTGDSEYEFWETIVQIISTSIKNDDDLVIICTQEHRFSEFYVKNVFINHLISAHSLGADLVFGGLGNFGEAVPITEGKLWVNPVLSCQFVVIYKKIYQRILDYRFKLEDTTTSVLSHMTSHKILLYPFISDIHPLERTYDYLMENGDIRKSTINESSIRISNLITANTAYSKP